MECGTSKKGNEELMGEGHEASQILITQNGSGNKGLHSMQSLTVRDEECVHTKWLDTDDVKGNGYVGAEGGQKVQIENIAHKIVPTHMVANVRKFAHIHNNYVGTEWIMVNRLKVIVRQGNLVDAKAEVIVNPANSEFVPNKSTRLYHSLVTFPSVLYSYINPLR